MCSDCRKGTAFQRIQDAEDRRSIVGICEEIEVIAVVEEISGRIPAPVGIGLEEDVINDENIDLEDALGAMPIEIL